MFGWTGFVYVKFTLTTLNRQNMDNIFYIIPSNIRSDDV